LIKGLNFVKPDLLSLNQREERMSKKVLVGCLVCLFLGAFLFNLKAKEVKSIHSSQLISMIAKSKSKLILLSFWASWCGPCRVEIPSLIKLRKEYSKKQLEIIGISIDQEPESFLNFVDHVHFNYPVFLGRQDVFDLFQVSGVPMLVFYNQNGQKIYAHEGYIGYPQLKQLVTNFLSKN